MKKKERLCVSDLLDDPVVTWPARYLLSRSMHANEALRMALTAVHMIDFEHYRFPENAGEIFAMLQAGEFPIFKEHYIIGSFGGRLMYLESNGWKSLPMTEDAFEMEHWLIYR